NEQYKNYFINRYADVMNTAYLTDRLLEVEQGIFNQAYPEMANEYERWGTSDIIGQMTDYYNRHIQFRNELSCRGQQVRDDIQAGFSLPQQVDVTLDVVPAGAGKIKISTITPDAYPWNGIYFDGVPIQIEAINNPGWLFDHWGTEPLITNSLNDTFLDTLSNASANFTAYFTEDLSSVNGTDNSDFVVYPSPANAEIYLVNRNGEKFENSLFQIVDIHGNLVLEGQLDNSTDKQIISVDQFSDGIYFVRILSEDAPVNLRFVKQ
ncbi:MAG: T9SS type A sorting domain-containing protein, partial [Crocinitomicaceae bacterium]|nr:T9SS type A sorting domain-containing protein [Crocinitomicaceae bacterium]